MDLLVCDTSYPDFNALESIEEQEMELSMQDETINCGEPFLPQFGQSSLNLHTPSPMKILESRESICSQLENPFYLENKELT